MCAGWDSEGTSDRESESRRPPNDNFIMPKRLAEPEVNSRPASKAESKSEAKSEVKPEAARPGLGRLVWLSVGAWLVPGLGHFLQGRRWRGLILFGSIVAMFLLGLVMKGEFFATQSDSYLQTLGYFGELCVGGAMPVTKFFGYSGDPLFVSSDYGTAFLVSAGMLNVLSILDAYDIAVGRKN